jgi:hypothetical protein
VAFLQLSQHGPANLRMRIQNQIHRSTVGNFQGLCFGVRGELDLMGTTQQGHNWTLELMEATVVWVVLRKALLVLLGDLVCSSND